MSEYASFLASKAISATPMGLTRVPELARHLFPFQHDSVDFCLRAGSAGLFLSTGLGKTACELEWAEHARRESGGMALILTPLAVARQIEREGLRWGYPVRVIRSQEDAAEGINICNYDRLDKLVPELFGAVVLDESSILKNFTGKTSRAIIEAFSRHRWRLSATATPAPNDHMELGTHSDFLGVMPMNDMLVRWFINDSSDTGTWRLKGYARRSYWDWMASWCRMADHPRDLGDDVSTGYDLPPLHIHRHQAAASDVKMDGMLFAADVSATGIHALKRQTSDARADAALAAIGNADSPFIAWCDTDYEADALKKRFRGAFGDAVVEVRGSMTIEAKEEAVARFSTGDAMGIITKPSVCGWGLNWQHCSRMALVGRSFSFEQWHQLVRRCWRFGQKNPVDVHLIVAEGEESIGRVIDRKSDDHDRMKREMAVAMKSAIGLAATVKVAYEPRHEGSLPAWL